MNRNDNPDDPRMSIDAVITSFDQGSMILEAVQSLCSQTVLPRKPTYGDGAWLRLFALFPFINKLSQIPVIKLLHK